MRQETGDVGRRTAGARARFSTRELRVCIASAAPAVALLGVPAIAQANVSRVQYWHGCLHAQNYTTGPVRHPHWMEASTSGGGGCYAGVAYVGASISSSDAFGTTRLRHATNPNGYVQTNRQNSLGHGLWAGCSNVGAHEHSFHCWSSRSY